MADSLARTTAYLPEQGMSHMDAMGAASARIYEQLLTQTWLLTFMDCFYILGVVTLAAAPLLLFARSGAPGGKQPEGY